MRIEVWLAPVVQPDDGLVADLDEAERAHANRINHPDRRAAYVSGHALTRRVIGRRIGLRPPDVPVDRFCRNCGAEDHGKPFVVGVVPPTVFSPSATAGMVGLAVAGSGSVGLDLDTWSAGRTWVRREAILKATGHGLAIDPTRVVVSGEDESPRLLHWPEGPLTDLHLFDIAPTPEIVGCVAWRGWCAGPVTVTVQSLEHP